MTITEEDHLISADGTTNAVQVFTCPAPPLGQRYRVLEEAWDTEQDPPVRYVHRVELIGEAPVPDTPMARPTSRLHAAANTLAVWDHNTGSGEDVGHEPEVLPEHWDGARQVWQAIQPKYETVAAMDALRPPALLVKTDREGVHIYRRRYGARRDWLPVVQGGMSVVGAALSAQDLLDRHGSLRLLWEGETRP